MGPDHTVCLTEHGKAVTMGRNIEAQLGKGHTHSGGGKPYLVKAMAEKEITLISAGATFTVVGTTENVLYFWGTRHIRYHKLYPIYSIFIFQNNLIQYQYLTVHYSHISLQALCIILYIAQQLDQIQEMRLARVLVPDWQPL